MAAIVAMAVTAAACGSDDGDKKATTGPTTTAGGASATTVAGSVTTDGASTGIDEDAKVVLGMATEPSLLDAHLTRDRAQNYATSSVNESLVEFDNDGEVIPLLAESFAVDPADPLKWIAKLRPGITFTNGEPWNADALVANVERILDPALNSAIPPDFSALIGAEKIDDMTVSLLLSTIDPIFDFRLLPFKMVPPVAAAEPGYADHPIGTGPYVFEEWAKGEHITLTANPDYWGDPKPTIGTVEFRFIPDESTRIAALKAGELDFAMNIPSDQLVGVDQVMQTTSPSLTQVVRLNLTVSPTSDVNFRQALNYAVNKEEINEALYDGKAAPNNCQLGAPGIGGFNPDLDPYPYDPEKAKELLAKVDLPDGYRLRIDTASARFSRGRELIQALADYWQKVGIDVEINDLESDAWRALALADRLSTQALYQESDYSLPHSIGNYTKNVTLDGAVSVRGDSYPELEDPLDRAFTSDDPVARDEATREVSKIICDAAFYVFVLDRSDTAGASARLHYDIPQGEFLAFELNRMTLVE